jgi:hypothetical protein
MADGVCGHEWKMEVEVFSLELLSYSVRMCEIWLQAYVSPQKAISLSAGLHEIRCSNRQSSTASNLGQGMRDQIAKSSIHCCWQKAVNTSVFQKASITV